jgi:hypothetical protein
MEMGLGKALIATGILLVVVGMTNMHADWSPAINAIGGYSSWEYLKSPGGSKSDSCPSGQPSFSLHKRLATISKLLGDTHIHSLEQTPMAFNRFPG